MTESVIQARNLHKTYRLGRVDVPVLRGVDFEVRRGEWVAILGASGSGKSTLLHLMGGLDRPDRAPHPSPSATSGKEGTGRERCTAHPTGQILFEGKPLGEMSRRELDRYRCVRIGFVFQFYHLLPELTVLENVCVATMIRDGRFGYARHSAERIATELLEAFGLAQRLRHRPAELSGGERQRVAIARALMNRPDLLLADEPTGNLDRNTGDTIIDAIAELREKHGQTMVMVTHDPAIAARAERIVTLEDGVMVEDKGRTKE